MNIRKKHPHNTPASVNRRRRSKKHRRPLYIKCMLSIFAFTLTLEAASRLPYLKSRLLSFARTPQLLFHEAGSLTLFSSDAHKTSDNADRDTAADTSINESAGNTDKDTDSSSGENASSLDSKQEQSDSGSDAGKNKTDSDGNADKNRTGSGTNSGSNEPDSDKNADSSSLPSGRFEAGAEDTAKSGTNSGKRSSDSEKPDTARQHLSPKDSGSGKNQRMDQAESAYPDTDTQWIFFSETDSDSQLLSGSRRLETDPWNDAETDAEHIRYDAKEWNLVLVNPWNELPDNYEIRLSSLPGGHSIDSRCYSYLMDMLDDCSSAGYRPLICSSYRTQEKQESLFQERMDELVAEGYSAKEARIKAASSVARPDTSEHQLGLAVDIVDQSRQTLDAAQEYTPVQQWLMKNSWKYGFILRYPQDKSSLTGIIYEPWHYRYVGVQAAEEIFQRGICLEEYLEEL